jgi:hypothetical protein
MNKLRSYDEFLFNIKFLFDQIRFFFNKYIKFLFNQDIVRVLLKFDI